MRCVGAGDGRILLVEISVKFGIRIILEHKETSSGDDGSPSACDGTPSGSEGRQTDEIASGNEGRGGISGTVGRSGKEGSVCRFESVGKDRIDGRCRDLLFQSRRLGSYRLRQHVF